MVQVDGGGARTRTRPFLALTVAVLCAVGIAIADAAVAGRAVTVLGLLATVPLVVASFSGIVGTVTAGCVAAGTLLLMADYDRAPWHHDVLALLGGVVLATVVASLSAGVGRRRVRRLHRVESVADVVQQTLLSPLPALVDDVAIAAHYASATRGAQVGGDVYEVLATPFGLRVFVGDVRGKGLPALHLANAALGAFREWSYQLPALADLAVQMDASVARNADPEEFVTAVLAEVGADAIDVVNCGHPAPLLISGPAVSPLLADPSLPLGLGVTAKPQRIPFGAGDRLLLFTDGVSEARRHGRFFDVADVVARCGDRELQECVDWLHRRLVKFARRRLDDDIAIVMLERVGRHVPDQLGLFSDQPSAPVPSV